MKVEGAQHRQHGLNEVVLGRDQQAQQQACQGLLRKRQQAGQALPALRQGGDIVISVQRRNSALSPSSMEEPLHQQIWSLHAPSLQQYTATYTRYIHVYDAHQRAASAF